MVFVTLRREMMEIVTDQRVEANWRGEQWRGTVVDPEWVNIDGRMMALVNWDVEDDDGVLQIHLHATLTAER